MPRYEIRVKVREEDVLDRQPMLRRKREVLVRVALRVDDDGGARRLVADHVGGVRETAQVELLEDHDGPPPQPPSAPVNWAAARSSNTGAAHSSHRDTSVSPRRRRRRAG